MSIKSKINIAIEIIDKHLKSQLSKTISNDWAYQWDIIDRKKADSASNVVDIAVVDDASSKHGFPESTVVVLLSPDEDNDSSETCTVVSSVNPFDIFIAIKRAYSSTQTKQQNRSSLVPNIDENSEIIAIARSLSAKVTQLIRQSEMRIALVEQMPVGVLGIDDENNIVLANPKAITILGTSDIPIWGMPAELILTPKILPLLEDDSKEITTITRNDEHIVVRKSTFELQGTFAGTILILTKDGVNREEDNIG